MKEGVINPSSYFQIGQLKHIKSKQLNQLDQAQSVAELETAPSFPLVALSLFIK